jgi:hypothetical protein
VLQLRGFENSFRDFAEFCDHSPTCPMSGKTMTAVLNLRERVRRHPLTVGHPDVNPPARLQRFRTWAIGRRDPRRRHPVEPTVSDLR